MKKISITENHIELLKKISNVEIRLVEQITMKDIFCGRYCDRKIIRKIICEHCNGTGSNDKKIRLCKKCQGKKIIFVYDDKPDMKICTFCNGIGIDTKINCCDRCHGERLILEEHNIRFLICVGITENEITIPDEGNYDINKNKFGDVIIEIKLIPENNFMIKSFDTDQCGGIEIIQQEDTKKTRGNHLETMIDIDFIDMLMGRNIDIRLPNDEIITIMNENIMGNKKIIIPNGGLPVRNNKNIRGNLIVLLNIRINLTSELKIKLRDALK